MTRHAYIDAETASHPAWLAISAAAERPADPEAWTLEHASDGATSPLTGLVTCIAVAADEGDVAVRLATSTEEESGLLHWLARCLERIQPDAVVGHNIRGFDAPFIRARALHQAARASEPEVCSGLRGLAQRLHTPKPWDGRLIDTLDPGLCPRDPRQTKGWTLPALAGLLGVEVAPTTPGSEAPRAWYERRFDAISAHCREDVRVLREVHQQLLGGVG